MPQTFAAGPSPSGNAPVAVAVDPIHHLVYAVERNTYSDIGVNAALPSDRVSVVNETTGAVITTIPVGNSLQGEGQGIAVDPLTQKIFVSNSNDNTVSVIDGTSNQVVATVPVGAGPEGVAVDSSLGLVYVANGGAGSISVLDASTGAVRGTITNLGGEPGAITVDTSTHLAWATLAAPSGIVAVNYQTMSVADSLSLPLLYTLDAIASDPGSRVYVSDYTTGSVAIVDVSGPSPSVVGQIYNLQYPSAVGVDPTTHDFEVAEAGHNQIDVYNSGGAPQATIPVERLPVAIAVDSAKSEAFVANAESDGLSVLNLAQDTDIGTDVLGTLDYGIALDPTTNRLYAANSGGDSVDVIDASTHQILAIWQTDPGPWAVAVDPALGQLYTLNIIGGGGGQTTLTVLSTTTGQILARLNPGLAGNGAIAVDLRTHMVYVTAGNGLSVIDGNTNQLRATVPVGSDPVGVAVDDAANRVFVANHLSGTISVIDATTYQVVQTWSPPLSNVWSLAVDPGLHQLYVSTPPIAIGDFSGVEVLDEDTGSLLGEVPTSQHVDLVLANPSARQFFMTDSDAGTVSVVDGQTLRIERTLTLGNESHGLAVNPLTGAVYVSNPPDGTISTFIPCPPTVINAPNQIGSLIIPSDAVGSAEFVGNLAVVPNPAGLPPAIDGVRDFAVTISNPSTGTSYNALSDNLTLEFSYADLGLTNTQAEALVAYDSSNGAYLPVTVDPIRQVVEVQTRFVGTFTLAEALAPVPRVFLPDVGRPASGG